MKQIICLLVVLAAMWRGHAQQNGPYGCILVDSEYKGELIVWDSPGGRVYQRLKQDFEGENFLSVDVLGQNDTMYYVRGSYAMTGTTGKGWIKKNHPALGIYSRAYSTNLNLYEKPDKASGIRMVVDEYVPELYRVLDCKKGWLLVEITYNKKVYKGWMEPDMQCPNHYSTCS